MARGNFIKGTVLVLGSIGLYLLGVETALLVFDGWVFRSSLWVYDSDLGFRVRPYAPHGAFLRANEFGFNDDDYSLTRSAETFRILIVGDSFNWIGGRDWNYIDLVEQDLQAQFGLGVEVINVGYPGTQPEDQLKMLQKFGMRYRPDLVVLGFFAGNDFAESDPSRQRIAYGGEVLALDPDEKDHWTLFGMPVLFRSRLMLNLTGRWLGFRQFMRSLEMSPERYFHLERRRMRFSDPTMVKKFEPYVEHVLSSLRGMRDLVVGTGGDFMIIAYPDEFQIDPRLRQDVIDFFGLDAESYQWNRAQKLLLQFCAEEGIEFHDLLAAFQAARGQGHILYIPNNSHWNQAGNRLAADLIQDILKPRVQVWREE